MRRWVVAWACLALAACSKSCVPVVSPPARDAGGAPARAMDLRTALMLIFPEWRGAQVVDCQAMLVRKVKPQPAQWRRDSEVALKANQFQLSDKDGALLASRPPFLLSTQAKGDELTQSVVIALSADDVSHVFQSPAPLSSEQMALWFPGFKASIYHEELILTLQYRAPGHRADFLTRQLVELSTAGLWQVKQLPQGWGPKKEDGGYGGVPEAFELTLLEKDSGAAIELKRDHEQVWLTYRLTTR